MGQYTIDKVTNGDLTNNWMQHFFAGKDINSYTDNEILDDIKKANELKSVLRYEKFKFNKLRNNKTKFKKTLNIIINSLILLGSCILLSVDILSMFIIIPFAILKANNLIMENKLNKSFMKKKEMYNKSIDQLDNFVDDLNNVLDSRKGKEIEENKIKNLSFNLSLDSKFYTDLYVINKKFSPKNAIVKVSVKPKEFMLTPDYYDYIMII